jgi:flavodoxin I
MIVIYGSNTGNCEDAAKKIASYFDNVVVKNVTSAKPDELKQHSIIIMGSSTWGVGEIQEDFEPFLEEIKSVDLSGHKIAIFGTGDGVTYAESFVDSMKYIYDAVVESGGTIIGKVDTSDYDFDESQSVIDGKFVGLPLDYENEEEKVESRIEDWVQAIKQDL